MHFLGHRMDGAFGRDVDVREPADQPLMDLTGTPTGVLALATMGYATRCGHQEIACISQPGV